MQHTESVTYLRIKLTLHHYVDNLCLTSNITCRNVSSFNPREEVFYDINYLSHNIGSAKRFTLDVFDRTYGPYRVEYGIVINMRSVYA